MGKRQKTTRMVELMTETVHCLKCDHLYEEKNNEFISICPKCKNKDPLETVYIVPEEDR